MKASEVEALSLELTKREQERYETIHALILTAQRSGDSEIRVGNMNDYKAVVRKLKADGFKVTEDHLNKHREHVIMWGRAKQLDTRLTRIIGGIFLCLFLFIGYIIILSINK